MKKCVINRLLGIVLFIVAFTSIPALGEEYQHVIQLDRMKFEWTLAKPVLHIRLQAKTKGWLGIGFNAQASMKSANFIIGYVRTGKVTIQDGFGIRDLEHIDDTLNSGRNDITGVSGSETASGTTLAFTIPLASGDKNDLAIDAAVPTKVLLAFGPDRDTFSPKHTFRTSLTVNLQTGQYK